ncbi:hypothetical protein GCM10022225_75970 [Plantactinospora mayteni]|uniref:Uncharacterized protein n=1 Tax=Plantactinospora mayteni TaxID=566021 RepID=A0ABQ4F1X2_9ACTN|nr:hypothetical protein [Plantactinospora mayteni]GIH00908.1 hypothetical protein Pma05_74800 [Plantactinospora mayteni]
MVAGRSRPGAADPVACFQDMLDHTSYAFTADTHTTVLPEQARQAAETTAQLVLTAQHKHPRAKPQPTEPTPAAA